MAAATENDSDGNKDYPGAVIVEKMAKAVVIHSMLSSKDVLRGLLA